MNIKQGEVFENSTDGVDFIVTKVGRDMVVIESQDGKRQMMTGTHTLASTSSVSVRKKEGEES